MIEIKRISLLLPNVQLAADPLVFLEHIDRESFLGQAQSRGNTSQAGTDDYDFLLFLIGHGSLPASAEQPPEQSLQGCEADLIRRVLYLRVKSKSTPQDTLSVGEAVKTGLSVISAESAVADPAEG